MKLSAPTTLVFWIAVVLAALSVLSFFIAIPIITQYQYATLLIGFVLLMLGNLLKGL